MATVYNFDFDSKEFIGSTQEQLIKGCSAPVNSTIVEPLQKKQGFAVVWSGSSWEYIEDHRDEVVFDINTKQEFKIKKLGKYPKNTTKLKPNQFDVWDGSKWVLDQAAFEAAELEKLKSERAAAIQNIKVTTKSGNVFDGNEISQSRLSRAISVMTDSDLINWVLADNSIASVKKSELQEALKLANTEMSRLWVLPYAN